MIEKVMIKEIRQYFIDNNIIDEEYRIGVDFLGENPTEFAILPIPVDPVLERYLDGSCLCQFQFHLLSRNAYSANVLQNIANSGYYEWLYNKIEELNNKKILPKIDGIISIECLDNGALAVAGTNTAQYDILMKTTYLKMKNRK